MSFINITTNNLSRELTNVPTFSDNWVYVPGASITGDWSRPVPISSLDEFRKNFGTHSPDGSITYEYVAGVLSTGLPVLFQRIACKDQASVKWTGGVPILPIDTPKAECASYTYSHTKTIEDEVADPITVTYDDIKVSEKWGGTYGNDVTVCIKPSANTYWIEVRYKGQQIEKEKIYTIKSTDDDTSIKVNFIDAINRLELQKVNVEVLCEVNPETGEYDVENFEIPVTNEFKQLTGGTDFDADLIKTEIPSMYNLVTDKVLYFPKFITSGGYTDDSVTDSSIGSAMKALTVLRQDCRALIDLPLGTLKEDYQTEAIKYAYTQYGGATTIPSASMCGPWMYMQVGNDQLWMPPSFVYLTAVGDAVSRGEGTYTPKAGLISGRVTNIIKPEFEIGSDYASKWQTDGKVQINPIMRLQSNNFVIAGNSTLLITGEEEVNAFGESSADLTVIEIRRFVYNLATELQFQYNNVAAFEKFSINSANFFEGMIKKGAITDYAITNISTDDDPRTLKIKVDVLVTPTIKAIEIYLNVAYGSVELNAGGEV